MRAHIDVDYLANTLDRLLHIPSPTGYTDVVVRACCEELDKLGVAYELTRRGAIRARMKGVEEQPARAIISHLDTLGGQVKYIKDSGRLEVAPIGHWSSRFAEGARCTIFTTHGSYRGTILPLKASGHTFNDEIDSQPVAWDHVELRIDAMTRSRHDTERLGIAIGDFIGIDPQPEFMDNGFINSRHLDNKAGVSVMLAAIEALNRSDAALPVDLLWLFSISEEVGVGASSVLTHDITSMVTVDNGTTAPGQNSDEFGVTISMADQTGPFDYHLTKKLVDLCEEHDIRYQKDLFRYYRSDSAAALEAGADVRTALVTFGIDASHGYERIHMHALRSLSELLTVYACSEVDISRDAQDLGPIKGFTTQPMDEADQELAPDSDVPEAADD